MKLTSDLARYYGGRAADRAQRLERRFTWQSSDLWLSDARWDREEHEADRVDFSTCPSFVLLREGTYTRTMGGATSVGDPTRAMMHNRDAESRISHPTGDRVRATTFVLSAEFLERALADLQAGSTDPERPFRTLHAPLSVHAYQTFLSLTRWLQSRPEDPLEVDEAVYAFVHRLLGDLLRAEESPADSARRQVARVIPDVQRRLGADLQRRLRLEDLAREAGCSRWRLSRIFREQTGIGLADYRRQLRLREALRAVLAGRQDLSRIAYETGFSSHAHLTNTFRRELGVAPSGVRSAGDRERVREWLESASPDG